MRRAALAAILWATAADAADPAITLRSPMDYQVFQRDTPARGKVLVSGQARVECDRVEARLTGDWASVAPDRAAGTFQAGVPAAAVSLRNADSAPGPPPGLFVQNAVVGRSPGRPL